MAHNVEPMDIDNLEGDFDNKENTYHHSNVLPRTPCTEKGYEELDVSELNMKLRYSITPASSPMSKSYTAHCLDNRNLECSEIIANSIDNANLTRSFNSTLTRNDSLSKSSKLQPLQLHSIDTSLDNNRNTSVLRPLDTTVTEDGNNITVTVMDANDVDENLSLPSSSSSALHTPEATTPTKEIPKHDGGSPIMRGLKSVLNMFRASQSPIPLAESEDNDPKHEISSPVDLVSNTPTEKSQVALASTPIAARKQKETSSKRGSPLKESIVFNEDLEKELLWKDETTILFSEEKIPIHKLFFQQTKPIPLISKDKSMPVADDSLNESVEFMDVSFNDFVVKNKSISQITNVPANANVAESDSEFVDCETTFTQQSDDEQLTEPDKETTAVNTSENDVNKTAQKLQRTATEESYKKPLNFMIAKELPEVVTQYVPELADNKIQGLVNSTVSIESKDIIYQDATQEIETNLKNKYGSESLDCTISTQLECKPSTSSTIMNITQDLRTQMPNDKKSVFDSTVTVNFDNTLSSSEMNNAIQSIEVTSSLDEKQPADTTVSIESSEKPMSVSSFIMNTTQNVIQFAAEQLNTTSVIEDKPISASTFIMNTTQNIKSPLAVKNVNEQLNITKTIEDNAISSSTFIMNEYQDIGISAKVEEINEQLNVTKNTEDRPELSTSLIMNETHNVVALSKNVKEQINVIKNIEAQSKPENRNDQHVETILLKSDQTTPTEAINVTQVIETEFTKPLDTTVKITSVDIPVSSSTFITNLTQNADSFLANNNENLDATVVLDSKDMLASSTFITDVTHHSESKMPDDNMHTPPDSTVIVDSQNRQVSLSTFVKDISQIEEKKAVIVTKEPISSSTFTKDIEGNETAEFNEIEQNLNSTVVVEATQQAIPAITSGVSKEIEICRTPGVLDVTLSADKSMPSFVDFKDITQQIIDPEVVNNCINALDVTLNTEVVNQAEENNYTYEPLDATVTIEASDAIPILPQDNTKTEIMNETVSDAVKDPIHIESLKPVNPSEVIVEQVYKQTGGVQITQKEIVKIAEQIASMPVNQDLLNSSGKIANVPIDIVEGKVLHMDDVNKKIEILESKGCGGNLPANVPLPDEDDLEIEPLKPIQECVINNVANLSVLPDVLNDLDSYKIQNVNQIDEVPINTIDDAKAPADIVTGTLPIKEIVTEKIGINTQEESNKNNSNNSNDTLNEITHKVQIDMDVKDELLKQVEKEILPENHMKLALSLKNSAEEINIVESEMPIMTSENNPESMDISYNVHDISTQKDSAMTSSNVTKVVDTENAAFYQKIFNEDKPNISAACDVVCSEAKIDSLADIKPTATFTKVNVLQNMSVDDMEIDIAPDAGYISENKETITSLQSMTKTDMDMVAKKEVIHEEIIVSENNSPYVLVSVDKEADSKFDNSLEDDFEQIENPFANKISPLPPASPPIASKGYNFNFDEIDDPFATKTKIRASPPLDSPKQVVMQEKQEARKGVPKREPVNKNKRKSFPVRPKPVITKKNLNSTFNGSLPTKNIVKEKSEFVRNDNLDVKDNSNLNKTEYETAEGSLVSTTKIKDTELNVVEKSELENNTDNISKVDVSVETANEAISLENKSPVASTAPSSSDQSVYLSAATSSGDSFTARNVFNLPEIDDINFNPFATKSKVRASPPPSLEVGDAVPVTLLDNVSENKKHNLSKNISEHDEKDTSNASNTTCSSKDDKNTTVLEVHTDSEDTIEGPFLEAEDNEVVGLDIPNIIQDDDFTGLGQNDMMRFSDLPSQNNEDNELFIDAEAYEFLLNQNQSNVVVDSGKESLFLKFDPLFAKRLSSEGIAAALSKIQKKQSTPKKMAKPLQIANAEQAVPGPSTSKVSPQQLNTTEDVAEDLNVTMSKPMMVVTPAVNPIVTPRKSMTPTSSNRRSITFTSPAIAVIDRLLSMSANNSLIEQNTTIAQVSREQNEADIALVQLRELLAEKEINVYNLRSESKELKDRLTTLESQMQALEAESQQRLKKVNDLTEKLTEKTKINKSMAAVVEEYERTIASLIAETEQDRKRHAEEREKLIKERDEQTAHLASMEVSFSDLHSKYEKSKQIILSCKANEDTYKKSIKDQDENLRKWQNNYELLKQHATSKLNHANQELEKMNRAHESEVLKLNAMIKRKEMHITSLEETLAQKTKANEELTAICDELINKVG